MPARARYISARAVPGLHTASLSAESSKKAARLKAHSPEPSIFTTSQELISALPSRMPHISPLCSPLRPQETCPTSIPRAARVTVEMCVCPVHSSMLAPGPKDPGHTWFFPYFFLLFLSLAMTLPFLGAFVHLLLIPGASFYSHNPESRFLQTLLPQASSLSLRTDTSHLFCPPRCPESHPHTCTQAIGPD